MARGPVIFKQRDLTRALKATKAAGVPVKRIEIEKDGKISMIIGDADSDAPTGEKPPEKNEWDDAR